MSNAVHSSQPAFGKQVAHAARTFLPLKAAPVALLLTALALLARWAVDPWIGDRHQFLPVYLAIAAATWVATWRSGALVALLFFLLGESLFGTPRSVADATATHSTLATLSYWLLSTLVVVAVHFAAEAHRRLRDRVQQLDEADHRKSKWMALLAHELRNPLAVLSADSEMIRKGKLDARALDGAWRALERQTTHMKRIVGDLLDTARVEQGKLTLQREMLNVAALLTQAVTDAEIFTAAKRQRLLLTMSGAAGYLLADPQRIRQVLDNLLHNASKFAPTGSAIRVALAASPDEVRISVSDSGIGMEPQELASIFQSFVQVAPGSEQMQGLGLGLALCRTLVEMHGGSIEAHSAGKGRGTEFVVRLPRPPEMAISPPVSPEAAPDPAAAAAAGDGAQAGAGYKVLVVDDNVDAADSLAMLLELAGHEAVVAYSGREAVETARKEQPRIVFLDMRLPDIQAAALAGRLREALAPARPALVGMSGLPPDESSAPADMASFMLKPFDMPAIVAALEAAARALERGAAA
jgi:signal transduction histidine kinase/ActR/RegA family two-component response regulator